MTVRVVSYNLLVPIYADDPEYYNKCQPEFLKTDYRWSLIQNQLEHQIVQYPNTIVCLQEICLSQLPNLELFFRRFNYSFHQNLYGGAEYNDYMGVGIAIPLSVKLNAISYIKVGDYIKSIMQNRKDEELENNSDSTDDLTRLITDSWETAAHRYNTLISLEILIDDKQLWIGTYHMPCLYKNLPVMAIHASIVKDLMFDLTAGKSFILAGDFNMLPTDTNCQALTDRNCTFTKLPKSRKYDISYRENREQVMKSAYKERNGREPAYTNFVDTSEEQFCGTLDYIFYNGELLVEDVLELPDHPTSASYPDETHPSDHLMIAATFRLM